MLLNEVLDGLQPRDGALYIDGTFGAGGYSRALLEAADCDVLAIDRDPSALTAGKALFEQFADRLTLAEGRFGDMDELAETWLDKAFDPPDPRVPVPDKRVDGIVFDIGVSSMQLDEAERGFSFQADGPLDMRMSSDGASAADLVNTTDEEELADIIYEFGEERRSRAIARAIVARRAEQPFTRTTDLANLIARVLGQRSEDGRHPATRTFQALRIAVNDELGELRRGLVAAERLLKPGGRLAVVTFHSLEDRIVKRFLAARAGKMSRGSRHAPVAAAPERDSSFRIVNTRPLTSSQAELSANPRARSARLRIAERTDAAAWPADAGFD